VGNKKQSKESMSISSEDVGSLDEILNLEDSDVENLMEDSVDIPTEDPFVDDTASAIRPITITPSYKINGLSPEREKEALKMLAEGVDINEVVEMFGVARSDVSAENARK